MFRRPGTPGSRRAAESRRVRRASAHRRPDSAVRRGLGEARDVIAELALDARAELGEGPVWDSRRGCLFFVDILSGRVHRFDPQSSETRAYEVGRMVGA